MYYTRQEDNEALLNGVLDYVKFTMIAIAMITPAVITAILSAFIPVVTFVMLGLAVPATLSILFRYWRVKRSQKWDSQREQQQEIDRAQRDAFIWIPVQIAAVTCITMFIANNPGLITQFLPFI